ncbi:hypothetical protein PINS_up009705 [Pythium insidiosum]|nr:hypothetical protein PINS_up009705 [Pythium insidiosum]
MIKALLGSTVQCDAFKLQLFLAKETDGAWLGVRSEDAVKLRKGVKTPLIEALTQNDNEIPEELRLDEVFSEIPEQAAIHILVMAPREEQKAAKRQKVASDVWMNTLQCEEVENLPPDVEGLRAYLKRELRVKIPITEAYSGFVQGLDTLDNRARYGAIMLKLFEPCDIFSGRTAAIVDDFVNAAMFVSPNATEDTYHLLWDSFIVKILLLVSGGYHLRNSNSSTSTGLYRPDLCFYCGSNVCVFRGEEEASGEIEVPIQKLHEKLIWRYDAAPYVFGYAAVGYEVCLVILRRDTTRPQGVRAEVIDQYNLSYLLGRLSFLLALLNLSTLFKPIVKLIQPLGYPQYGILTRPNGVRLAFGETCVTKTYPQGMATDAIINKLKTVHRQMKAHSVPNVATLIMANLKKRCVSLAPLGLVQAPKTVRQLVTALQDILKALVALHELNLMHRDLRWDNVMKYEQDQDQWFLIDFDEAATSPASHGAEHLNPNSHAPEITSPHSVKVDIWGVGHLIETLAVGDLPPELTELQESCLQESPHQRPTAVALLSKIEKLRGALDRPAPTTV